MLSNQKKESFKGLIKAAVDTLLPPRCLATGHVVDSPGMTSPAFWSELSFIEKPCCSTCGLPFGFQAPFGTLCAACLDLEPVFTKARSAVVYNDASRKIILAFKYGDRLHAVHTFIPWLMRAGQELLDETDFIVPVPLHQKRLWQRRFNQSALLADELAGRAGKIYLPDTLIRTRATIPQKGLSRNARNDNVKNAFSVRPAEIPKISGKNILLIDDVFTSGATLNECARVLKKSGAADIFVLTIARVTREEFGF